MKERGERREERRGKTDRESKKRYILNFAIKLNDFPEKNTGLKTFFHPELIQFCVLLVELLYERFEVFIKKPIFL